MIKKITFFAFMFTLIYSIFVYANDPPGGEYNYWYHCCGTESCGMPFTEYCRACTNAQKVANYCVTTCFDGPRVVLCSGGTCLESECVEGSS